MSNLVDTINGLQDILGICPCCGEIFRLVEGKFVFPQKQPRKCEYLELLADEQELSTAEERLQTQVDRFDQKLESEREELRDKGRRLAKRRLKRIDPTFSGKNIDPQDVKAIFHPVEYVIFHGLTSIQGVKSVELVSRIPMNRTQERIAKSIGATVRRGDVKFETLHMKDDGTFEVTRA